MDDRQTHLAAAFQQRLVREHLHFDAKVNMIAEKLSRKGYHTHIDDDTVHGVYRSLAYAAALLYSGDDTCQERALAIIDNILSMQDTEEDSPTYGIWPYYLEEPLPRMKSPDWNWADFNGKVLVYLLLEHREALPSIMIDRIILALHHAAASIIRRNIGPDYTNIYLMGAYVTIAAGELLDNQEFVQYGRNRLIKERAYVEANGGFTEYNSPTYTVLALEEIGRMLKHVKDRESRELAEFLNDKAWECIAVHFHRPTCQLSAPHSRCYENISGQGFLSFLHLGTRMQLGLMREEELEYGLMWHDMVIACPDHYYEYFQPLKSPRLIKETFYKGEDLISDDEIRVFIEKGTPRLESTTYMNPSFSLGSFAEYDLWNQRRPLMAYWGTPENCTYLRLRCLHDGQDYASAILRTSQQENHLVGGVYFVKDHGDFHFILDPLKEGGKLRARKLSLRFEIGGWVDQVQLPQEARIGSAFSIRAPGIAVHIHPLICEFDQRTIRVEIGEEGPARWIEFILFEGEEQTLDFERISQAAFVFGLSVFDEAFCPDDGDVRYSCALDQSGREATGQLARSAGTAAVTVPLKPSQYINNPSSGRTKIVKNGGFMYE
ncbi:hypothetical protein [Cohnella fermenti]|uniref:Heparinase n=1 Tax=Cohnella fermenti TaxID=2565925 RepID=A0A4S4BRY1_9BACL|nr:hypothetical protein [Cohnella fermenti]THF77732.1 hypothetical protein E6C55_15435 [Cohnella fermenti]